MVSVGFLVFDFAPLELMSAIAPLELDVFPVTIAPLELAVSLTCVVKHYSCMVFLVSLVLVYMCHQMLLLHGIC